MTPPKEPIPSFDATNADCENDGYGDMGYNNYVGGIFGGGGDFNISCGRGGRDS